MRKLKAQVKTPLTIKQFLDSYDYKTLQGALSTIHNSFAWELLRSYFKLKQREFEVASLDLVTKNSMTQSAAHASGYAQGMEDAADKLIPEFLDLISGNTGVVENPRPEDKEDRFEAVNS